MEICDISNANSYNACISIITWLIKDTIAPQNFFYLIFIIFVESIFVNNFSYRSDAMYFIFNIQ